MVIGACRVELELAENYSLKGKRQIVRSVTTRLRTQFNLAVAEVDENEIWNRAVLGIACVSNDSQHAREMLDKAVRFIERARVDAEVTDSYVELFRLD
jgi:uncharacterized protein YlxP (DUF503 family)